MMFCEYFVKILHHNILSSCGDRSQPVTQAYDMKSFTATSIFTSIVWFASATISKLIIYQKINVDQSKKYRIDLETPDKQNGNALPTGRQWA